MPIKIIECPRDAMQGWKAPISTQQKINYLNVLLQVGFDTLDFGSFVSPKAIPQMADTAQVLDQLNMDNTQTKLLAIIANERGAEEACSKNQISYLGFPFSISPTFQQRNTNSTQTESVDRIKAIQNLCVKNNKKLVVYLSMGFGNPYGDEYNEEILLHWANEMAKLQIPILSLADTVGMAKPEQITWALNTLIPAYPSIEMGVHLHAKAEDRIEKLQAAINANCTRFDGALKGFGGCPMAQDDLVGNMDTEGILHVIEQNHLLATRPINVEKLEQAKAMAAEIFV